MTKNSPTNFGIFSWVYAQKAFSFSVSFFFFSLIPCWRSASFLAFCNFFLLVVVVCGIRALLCFHLICRCFHFWKMAVYAIIDNVINEHRVINFDRCLLTLFA